MLPGGEYTAPATQALPEETPADSAIQLRKEQSPPPAIWQAAIKNAGRLAPGTWISIVCAIVAIASVLHSWSAPAPKAPVAEIPKTELTPQTQATYNRQGIVEEAVATLDDVEREYSLFLSEEEQRLVAGYASVFQSQAARFMALQGHPCSASNATLVACLESFNQNRDKALRKLRAESEELELKNAPQKKTVDPLKSLDRALQEHYRILGLRLAIVRATPAEQRPTWQQTWLEENFPLALEVNADRELQPSTHLAQRRLAAKARDEFDSLSADRLARQQESEDCFALPIEEQPEEGC